MNGNQPESIELVEIECGALHLKAPAGEPEFIVGTHGQVLQWTGDGVTLVTSSVAVRRNTRMVTSFAQENHLNWELERLAEGFDGESVTESKARIELPGASGAATAASVGTRLGLATYNRFVVTSDGQDQYVVHVMATDTPAGRALAEEMVTGVRF